MLCPSCGKTVGMDVKLCEECQTRKDIKEAERASREPELPLEASSDSLESAGRSSTLRSATTKSSASMSSVRSKKSAVRSSIKDDEQFEFHGYAGFFLRALAFLLDAAFLSLILHFIALAAPMDEVVADIEQMGKETGYALGRSFGSTLFLVAFLTKTAFPVLFLLCSQFVLGLIYYGVFEASEKRATPGKLLLGLAVCDIDGNRLTLFESSSRHLVKVVSFATFGFGFVMAAISSHKQALHDVLTGSVVIKEKGISIVRVISVCLLSATFATFSLTRGYSAAEDASKQLRARSKKTAPALSTTSGAISSRTDGIVQVGSVNQRLRGAVAVYNPKDYHAYFYFFRDVLSEENQRTIKRDPKIETIETFKPDLRIRLRFARGLTACDAMRVEQMQVALLDGRSALPLQTQFNFAGILSDKLQLNCRLNDGAFYRAEFNAIANSQRQQIRWDVESSGYIYFTDSLTEVPLGVKARRASEKLRF